MRSLIAAAMLLGLLMAAPLGATASSSNTKPALTWEQVLADNSASGTAGAKASAASAAAVATPAHGAKSPSSVPAITTALSNFWATLTWNAAEAKWDCVATAQPGSVGTARCTVYPAMIALVLTCPGDGKPKQAIAPSCFHPYIGDAPSTVYGWFVRDDKVACGFTPPPQQEAPFVVGASGYCMTVAEVVPAKTKKGGGGGAHSGR